MSAATTPLPLLYSHTAADDSLLSGNDLLFRPVTGEMMPEPWGMTAHPMTTTLQFSDCITLSLLLCVLLLLVIRRIHHPHLPDTLKNFLFPSNSNTKDTKNKHQEELRATLALLFSVQAAILAYAYALQHQSLTAMLSPWLLLSIYTGLFLCFFICRQGLYHIVHIVFFENTQRQLWRRQYAFLFAVNALLLFPLLLLFIYLHLDLKSTLMAVVLLLLFIKILLLFRCFSIFFAKNHGVFHLFMYFCALEAAPLVVLCAILADITNRLTTIW